MGESIIDGTGNRYGARVDEEGRLHVSSDMVPHPQHHSMTHKNLFLGSFHVTLDGTSETPLAFFKNLDSDIDFEFYITQLGSDGDVTARFYFDDEYTSGGTIVTPLNLNRGSGLTIATNRASIYDNSSNDLVLDTTDGQHFHTMYLAARSQELLDFQGGLIITNGKSASCTVQGASTTKVHLLVMTSYHKSGTEL